MHSLGLTASKEALLIQRATVSASLTEWLEKRCTITEPLNDLLFQRLREEQERNILRELKKRGSILEPDLQELSIPSIKSERVKNTLDYLSGAEYQLVDRKFAIVCKETREIIFLMRSKEDIDNAKALECPKCARKLDDEDIVAYYLVTDELKNLLDGNRWMPLLIRESLLKVGVSADNIYTEIKHGEDEIDVLVFHKGQIFVIEAKNRTVSLNDAYKLSAKTARIESVVGRFKSIDNIDLDQLDDATDIYSRVTNRADAEYYITRTRTKVGSFMPIVISTHDIAKDAQDLLKETKQNARFLEKCDGKIDEFIGNMVEKVNNDNMERRLFDLINADRVDGSDSVASLAAVQVQTAFMLWFKAQGGLSQEARFVEPVEDD